MNCSEVILFVIILLFSFTYLSAVNKFQFKLESKYYTIQTNGTLTEGKAELNGFNSGQILSKISFKEEFYETG